MWFFLLLILPVTLYAQKDVTQFLDIPIDGYKVEMIKKLKSARKPNPLPVANSL